MNTQHDRAGFCPVAIMSMLLSANTYGQSTSEMLSVESGRPVKDAIAWLLERYPTVITYEDPRYEFAGDIQDVTSEVRKDDPNSPNRILVPRRSTLQASFLVSDDNRQPLNMADVVQQIVQTKNAVPMGGRFEVRQSEGIFHVVPTEARNGSGSWARQQSILDTPITLSTGELEGITLIEAILKEVSEISGTQVHFAGGFINWLLRYTGTVEAENEPSRDVLIRTLHSISPRFTWVLNYSPSFHYYVFNLALAAEQLPEPKPLDLSILPRPGDPTPAGPPFDPAAAGPRSEQP